MPDEVNVNTITNFLDITFDKTKCWARLRKNMNKQC